MKKKNNSKKSIIQQLSKRFQTTIIGSLARFEDQFGYLWGLNTDKELTDRQKEFLDLWEYTRTSILNHGNNPMRDAIDEIIDYLEQETDSVSSQRCKKHFYKWVRQKLPPVQKKPAV